MICMVQTMYYYGSNHDLHCSNYDLYASFDEKHVQNQENHSSSDEKHIGFRVAYRRHVETVEM